MADVNANIGVSIDTSEALAQLKALQRQISQFHTSIAKSSETAALAQRDLQRNFLSSVNALGAFSAELRTVRTTSESFTDSLEKNKFSMREYFRYAGGATKTFGRLFKSEFDTIGKVAEDRVKKLQTQYIKLGRDTSGAMKAIAIIPNELDLKNFSTQTQLAAQRQALFNQLMKQGSTNLLNFGKNTQWAGRQLMVGFTLPLASLGVTATKTFMNMEQAALKFRKVYGDLFTPREETQQALDDVTALGQMFTRYGIAVSDTVGLAAEAAAAGFQGIDLQRQTAQATRLSVLGQIEQQKALETTISLQNAFKMSSEDLAGSIDFLNAVENQTVVSLDDITTAIPKVAPVIQQLGGDVKDLAFFMAAMKEGGVNASEGANALKSGLAALINPTEKAAAMLGSMGINIKQIIETNKGNLKATVIEFAQALDTLDPLTRARAIEQLFGKFQFARLSTLFDNVTNQTGQAARVLDLAGTSIEDLAALSEQELGMTADSAMNKFRKSVEDLKMSLVPVGQTFLEAVTPIVEFIGNILEKFNNLSSGVKKAIVVLTVAIGAIGPVALMTFGLLANGLANIVKGAMILRQGYLRLTGQSQILGEQTEYLTSEQINATAVAHSLDQSHARLIQTFTSETAALAELINVYQSAGRAAANFAIQNPGMMVPPRRRFNKGTMRVRKYASGVVMVPGSGNKDTVPAMLTPGEAVIPSDMAKQYAPLIEGMIAGNIPGYQSGLEANITSNLTKTDFAHITDRAVITIQEFLDSLNALPEAMKAARQNLINKLDDIKNAFGADLPVNIYSGLGFTQKKSLNLGMSGGKAVSAKEFLEDFQKQGIEKWSTTLKIGGAKLEDVSSELTQYDQALQSSVQSMLELNGDAKITSNQFALLEREVRNTLPATSSLRQALDLAENTITEYRINLNKQMALDVGLQPYKVASTRNAGKMSSKEWIELTSGRAVRLGGEHDTSRTLQGYGQMPKTVVDQIVAQTASAAQVQSPSKRTIPIGEDIARGLQVGMINELDDTKRVAQQIAQAGSSLIDPRTGRPFAPVSPGMGGTPGATINQIASQAAIGNQIRTAIDEEVQVRKTTQSNLTKFNNILMSSTFALTSLAGAGSFASGKVGELSQAIFKYSGLLFGLMTVTQLLTQTKIAEIAATRLAVAKQATAFATYGAGLTSRAGLLGSLARLGLGITKFLGPVGLIITALTVGYAIYKKINNINEENRQRLEAFGDAVSTSTKQLKSLGDYFGVVATQTPLERTKLLEVAPPQARTAREQLKASEAFKDLLPTVKAVSRLDNEDALQALRIKGIELLAKGFSRTQVQIIIDSIREEAGKTTLTLDFNKIKFDSAGIKKLNNEVGILLTEFQKIYSTGLEKTFSYVAEGEGRSARIKVVESLVPNKEAKAALSNQAKTFKSYLNGISGLFNQGTIDAKNFNNAFNSFTKTVIEQIPDADTRTKLFNKTLSIMDSEVAKGAVGITNFQDQILLLKSAMIGVTGVTADMIRTLKEAATTVDVNLKQEAAAVRREIERLNEVNAAAAAAAAGKGKGKGTGEGEESYWVKQRKAILTQIEAIERMRKANISAAVAAELAANPEAAKAIVGLAKKGGEAWATATKQIKAYRDAQKELEKISLAAASRSDYELGRLEIAQKSVDVQEKLIDLYNAPQLKQYNDQLDYQSLILKKIEKQIKAVTDAEIVPREAIIKQNNYKLEEIAILEEGINKKYDEQEKALSRIFEINQDILSLEKSRLSIADALTSGDISAAAQAANELQAQQLDAAQNRQNKILAAAREQELAVLGRTKIEQQNKKLQLELSRIQRSQLDGLELAKDRVSETIDLINDQVYETEQIAKAQKDSIRYFGMTKQQIEGTIALLRAAKDAGIDVDNNIKTFIDAGRNGIEAIGTLLNVTVPEAAQNALDEIQKLRDSMNLSSTITVTAKTDGVVASIDEVTEAWKRFNAAAELAAKNAVAASQAALGQSSGGTQTSSSSTNALAIAKITEDAKTAQQQATDLSIKAETSKQQIAQEVAAAAIKAGIPIPQSAMDILQPKYTKVGNTFVPTGMQGSSISSSTEMNSWLTTQPASFLSEATKDYLGTRGMTTTTYSDMYMQAQREVEAENMVSELKEKVFDFKQSVKDLTYQLSENNSILTLQDKSDLVSQTDGSYDLLYTNTPIFGMENRFNLEEMLANTKRAVKNIASSIDLNKINFGTGDRSQWMASGGIVPKYFAKGGFGRGTDTIPAMLTPGEFVVSRPAVKNFGVQNLEKINDGDYNGNSVYNYSINVNVKSGANADDIARTVMTQIKQIDSQRIRGQRA